MLYIHPDECVDCGACEPVCPVEAIYYEDDVPEQWKDFYKANVEFFDDLGSPGGASKTGKIDKDHAFVAGRCRPWTTRRPLTALRAVAGRSPGLPLGPARALRARPAQHPDGIVDLSVGTPVDPTPAAPARRRSRAAADAPGYPLTAGSSRPPRGCLGLVGTTPVGSRPTGTAVGVLPTIGSKELVALLRVVLLGVRGDVLDAVASPTPPMRSGRCSRAANPVREWTSRRRAGLGQLALQPDRRGRSRSRSCLPIVARGQGAQGAIVVSDECYLELSLRRAASPSPCSHPSVNRGSLEGILAVHSLSKRSTAAGFRLGLVSGDAALIGELLERRKHAGLIVPAPIQAAGIAAFRSDDHVALARERYLQRRQALLPAFEAAGFTSDGGPAGLYLWLTRGASCWDTVGDLAQRGILVAPGEFYGPAGSAHVRVALTATDERVAAAVSRLRAAASSVQS